MIAESHQNKTTAPAVSIRAIKKGFGAGSSRVEVLLGIDLDAYSGEILLLVGPSGCGKTTLLTIIAGLLNPDEGSVQALGKSITALSDREKTAFRRDNIGFIFQQFNLLPTLTAAENAAIPLFVREIPRRQAIERASEVLKSVGLAHRLKSLPSKLSGGEQQRVAIARSLVADPKMLICDEPTAALDGETGFKIMETMRATALRSDRCVIIVTHDNRIFRFGDRIASMADGTIHKVEQSC